MQLHKFASIIFFVFSGVCVVSAQTFPGTSNKIVIGRQTTALGVASFSSSPPTTSPIAPTDDWRNTTYNHVDTVAQIAWAFQGLSWKAQGFVRRATPPPATASSGTTLLDYRYAFWLDTDDSTSYNYDIQANCWKPLGAIAKATAPVNVSATGSTGAVCYDDAFWRNTALDSIAVYTGGTWVYVGGSAGGGGGVSDGDKGDILVGGGGTVWTIDNNVVSSAKMTTTGVGAGSYTNANITVDAAGRVTAAANGTAGGVTDGNKGDITVSLSGTNWQINADAVGSNEIAAGAVGASELASTTVTPGSYTAANITVDADGRITAAANGSGGGGGISDGDKGDITVSVSGTVWTIDNAAVTTTKLDSLDYIKFNRTIDLAATSGQLEWDATKGSLQLGLENGVEHIVGQMLYYAPVTNQTGTTIGKGVLVMGDTTQLVQGNRIRIQPANSNTFTNSEFLLGITVESIAHGSNGFITWFGDITNITLSAVQPSGETWAVGDILYPNPNDKGFLTKVAPSGAAIKTPVAIVQNISGANLTIKVRMRIGDNLNTLGNVSITTPTNSQILRYNSTTGLWANQTIIDLTDGNKGDIIVGSSGTDFQINANAVGSNEIATGAVGADEIATGAVGSDEIATSAVIEAKIATNAVTAAKIATGAVLTDELGTGAVTDVKIATDAVTSSKIAAGAVTSGKIATGAVGATELASTTVTPNTYNFATITVDADGRITNAATGVPVDNGDRGDITVSASGATWTIDAGAVTDTKIATSAVTETKIANDAVTAAKIATGAVGADELASTAVTPGAYTSANITVDADGRITAAANGSGGGGTPAGSTGEIQFNNAGAFGASSNLFWDAGNSRLGVGVNTSLMARAHVRGSGTSNTSVAFEVENNSPRKLLEVRDDGLVTVGEFSGSANRTVVIAADIDKVQPDTNINLTLTPRGTGALIAGYWGTSATGSIAGGNARGARAVDLQMSRTSAAQVASGAGSSILGGERNTSSGRNTVVAGGAGNSAAGFETGVFSGTNNNVIGGSSLILGGTGNQIDNLDFGTVIGGGIGRAYLQGQVANAMGGFSGVTGSAQTSRMNIKTSVTGDSTTITQLWLNDVNSHMTLLGTNRIWNAKLQCSAIVSVAGTGSSVVAGDALVQSFELGIKRVGSSTSLVGSVITTLDQRNANMAGAAFLVDADDSNAEALRVRFKPAAGSSATTVTRCHCAVHLSEVGY